MIKVKLFAYVDAGYDYESQEILTHGISDWEEVTQQEFDFIRANIHILSHQNYGQRFVLVAQPEHGVLGAITSIKEAIEDGKKREAERLAKAKAKKQAEADKLASKARDKELQQLKKLQEKYATEL